MKKLIFLLLVALLWPNAYSRAAYNDVQTNADVTVNISDLGINLRIENGASIDSYTVNSGNLQVTMSPTSTIKVISSDRRTFTVSPSSGWGTFTTYCDAELSYVSLALPVGAPQTTVTITPSGSGTTCSSGGGGSTLGSGSSSGGGGSAALPSPVPIPLPTLPPQARARVRGLPFILAGLADGTLVKGSGASVYYYQGGRRFVFINDKAYKTWYKDFSGVKKISDSELASVPLGGNITYKSGVKMVKITTDPKVYAVDKGGVLRWIKSEAVAVALYGANWNKQIDDVSDANFSDYTVGADIGSASDFNPSAKQTEDSSIAADFGL